MEPNAIDTTLLNERRIFVPFGSAGGDRVEMLSNKHCMVFDVEMEGSLIEGLISLKRVLVRTETERYPSKFRPPTFPPMETLEPICREGEQEQQRSFVFTCIDGFPTATACVGPNGYGQIPLGGQQVIENFLIKCSNESGLVSLRFVACVYEGKIYYPGMGKIPFVGEEQGNFYGKCAQKPGGILKLMAAGCQDDRGRFFGAGDEFVNSGKKYK
uniref:Uncharacterized protein n=1 Tax=Romanomermis culicivorax TaxID=13658 RepID=A0A915I951_ROMCU